MFLVGFSPAQDWHVGLTGIDASIQNLCSKFSVTWVLTGVTEPQCKIFTPV